MQTEHIVVSMTTWSARIINIPTVLDSIFGQTLKPSTVVLNLSCNETIPDNVDYYLHKRNVIVNRVNDTKVYKKLFPTLCMFPDACVINIDDDFIYPENMIKDFMTIHTRCPNRPISGNRQEYMYLNCHCGCASLTKRAFFGKSFELLDDEVMAYCPSDDLVYTYLLAKEGKYYIRTANEYFINMPSINSIESYSESFEWPLERTWEYLTNRFGVVQNKNVCDVLYKKTMHFVNRVLKGI